VALNFILSVPLLVLLSNIDGLQIQTERHAKWADLCHTTL